MKTLPFLDDPPGLYTAPVNGEKLKKKVRAGGVVYGSMISMGRNPRWTTPLDDLGLDYVIIDTEHSPRDRAELGDYLAATKAMGPVPIVRVPIPDSHYVTMALDAGAQGVLAPYCETVEEVRDVVGAAKWRPLKGALVRKVVEHGEFPSQDTKAYLEDRNRNVVCIIGIESVPAIDTLPAILEVPGIDAIFVGPNDLSISLGIPDRYDHLDYEAALRTVLAACRARGMPVLIHHHTVELTTKWLREGARFVLHSSDVRQMHAGYRADFGAIKAVAAEITGVEAADTSESRELI